MSLLNTGPSASFGRVGDGVTKRRYSGPGMLGSRRQDGPPATVFGPTTKPRLCSLRTNLFSSALLIRHFSERAIPPARRGWLWSVCSSYNSSAASRNASSISSSRSLISSGIIACSSIVCWTAMLRPPVPQDLIVPQPEAAVGYSTHGGELAALDSRVPSVREYRACFSRPPTIRQYPAV